jgi:NADP-dependent 3-hydroxy acid dehydrogenase YdfG
MVEMFLPLLLKSGISHKSGGTGGFRVGRTGGAVVINVGCIACLGPMSGATYTATKAGLRMYSDTIRIGMSTYPNTCFRLYLIGISCTYHTEFTNVYRTRAVQVSRIDTIRKLVLAFFTI